MCSAWFQRGMFLVRKTKAFMFSCLVWIQDKSLYPQGVLGENLFTRYDYLNWRYMYYFFFQLCHNSMNVHEKQLLRKAFFGFDKNHTILLKDKSLQFMVMFSILFLYMCMYLIQEKAVSTSLVLSAFEFFKHKTASTGDKIVVRIMKTPVLQ